MPKVSPLTSNGRAGLTGKIILSLATRTQMRGRTRKSTIAHWGSPIGITEESRAQAELWFLLMAKAAPSPRAGLPQRARTTKTPRSSTNSKTSRSAVSCHDLIPSAAGFRLRDVTLYLLDVGAINGANQTARAIVDVNLRD